MSPLAVVLADTHIPRRARALPKELVSHLKKADLVLHAGDLIEPSVLDELSSYAPVRAVKGNVDLPEADLPQTLEFEFGGVRVAMIHDSGRKEDRRRRLKKRFPEVRVVVFGHSHVPFLEDEDGLLLLKTPAVRRTGAGSHATHSLYSTLKREGFGRRYWRFRGCAFAPPGSLPW